MILCPINRSTYPPPSPLLAVSPKTITLEELDGRPLTPFRITHDMAFGGL